MAKKALKDLTSADIVAAVQATLPAGYHARDVSDEGVREIVTPAVLGKDLNGKDIIVETVYRIEDPIVQIIRDGGTTIRFIDAKNVVHLVPGPGYRGANHRWYPREGTNPVAF